MTTVGDVTGWLERFAPAGLAEPWDNVGLIWGDPSAPAGRVMTCLTVTPTTAGEAIEARAELIVSHHPVLFREVKKIRADWPDTGYLWKLARAGISVASPHTAFDNTENGINDLLCSRLEMIDVVPLRGAPWMLERAAIAARRSFKVVVFTPEGEREAVSAAAFRAAPATSGHMRNVRSRFRVKALFSEPKRPIRWSARAGSARRCASSDWSLYAQGRDWLPCSLRFEAVIPTRNRRSTYIRCTSRKSRPMALRGLVALDGWRGRDRWAGLRAT